MTFCHWRWGETGAALMKDRKIIQKNKWLQLQLISRLPSFGGYWNVVLLTDQRQVITYIHNNKKTSIKGSRTLICCAECRIFASFPKVLAGSGMNYWSLSLLTALDRYIITSIKRPRRPYIWFIYRCEAGWSISPPCISPRKSSGTKYGSLGSDQWEWSKEAFVSHWFRFSSQLTRLVILTKLFGQIDPI